MNDAIKFIESNQFKNSYSIEYLGIRIGSLRISGQIKYCRLKDVELSDISFDDLYDRFTQIDIDDTFFTDEMSFLFNKTSSTTSIKIGQHSALLEYFLMPASNFKFIEGYRKYFKKFCEYINDDNRFNISFLNFSDDSDFLAELDSFLTNAENVEEEVFIAFSCDKNSTVHSQFNAFTRSLISYHELSFEYAGIKIFNNDEADSLIRTIEFTPETYDAGIGILNYFGTYLRDQYPEKKAHILIEQNDLSVKMTIKSETGRSETLEKAFNEYGQIMSGSSSANDFVSNPILIAKLENKIDLLNAELNSERRLNNLQATTIKDFIEMFRISHDKSNNYHFALTNTNSSSVSITIKNDIASTIGTLRELKEALPTEGPLQNELDDITQSFETIENETNLEVVKRSSALSKLKRFIDKVNKGQDMAASAIKTVERGTEIFSSLVAKYQGLVDLINSVQ